MLRDRVVQTVPSTSGISDPQVRTVLDALTNIIAVRSGDVGNGDHRFITAAEFKNLSNSAITDFFASSSGGGGPAVGGPPTPADQLIASVAESVFQSQLFHDLGEHIRRISAPWETLDLMSNTMQAALRQFGKLKNGFNDIRIVTDGMVSELHDLHIDVGQNSADIIQINTINVTSTSANALALVALTGRVGANEANITQINTLAITSTSASAVALYQVRASMGNVARTYWQDDPPAPGPFNTGDQWFDTNDSETHYYWNGSAWTLGSITPFQYSDAGIVTEKTARVTADTSLAAAINTIWSAVGNATATIVEGALTSVTGAQTAFANHWTTVQTAVYDFATNTNKVAAVDQRITTTIDLVNNKFQAEYTLRVEVGPSGRTTVGGFGIIGSMDATHGPTIDFGVRADRFWITSPNSGDPDSAPFIVRTTPGPWGPKGVYIDTAYIGIGTITVAMIDKEIKSTNYVSNTSGWRINSASGDAEFNNILVRGTSTVSRLAIKDVVEGSITVANNVEGTVTHNEGRKVIINYWSPDGIPVLHSMTDNTFVFGLGGSGGTIYYRYF